MVAILITGVPASGKTSVAECLKDQGWNSIDADTDSRLARWVSESGEELMSGTPFTMDELDQYNWEWDVARVRELIRETEPEGVFLCGTSNNERDLMDCFEKVILLEIDVATMVARLDKVDLEGGSGSSGNDNDATYEQIDRWLPPWQEGIRRLGATVVDATAPLLDVVNSILIESLPAFR
jgi:adenylate kinase family enzyme